MLAHRPAHVPERYVVDFDIYNPPGGQADYYQAWGALQFPGGPDLVWTPRNGGHWIAVRGHAIEAIWKDYQNFSSRIQIVPKSEGEEHQLLPTALDPPKHTPFRAILNEAMAPRRVIGWEKPIRALSISLIDGVIAQGHCNFASDYAERLPVLLFLTMCGLPVEDAALLKMWADRMLRPDGIASREDVREFFRSYLLPVITERRGGSGDDLISLLINSTAMGKVMDDSEALQMCTSILFAGLDTVVNLLAFIMAFLATNSDHRRALAADRSLIPAAIEEFVRRFPLVTIGREVTRDQHFSGVDLCAGDVVILPSALHGIDERQNERPREVDFKRHNGQHSTFGQGAHRCVGLLLAKMELRISLEEWFARIPDFHLAPGTQLKYESGSVASLADVPLVWPVA